MQQLTPRELADMLGRDEQGARPILLDVREPWEFDICRLEGSRLMPLGQLFALGAERLDPAQETVIICHHGIRSRQACRFLQGRGFDKLINLTGGVEAWAREVDPQMATY